METVTIKQLAEAFKKTRATITKYLRDAKLVPAEYLTIKQTSYYDKNQAYKLLNKAFNMELK